MAYHLVGLLQIQDPASFERYRAAVGDTLLAYSGRVSSRGEVDTFIWDEIGCGQFQAVVTIEFPDKAAAQNWAAGPEYQQLLNIRRQALSLTLFGVEQT